MRQWTFGRKCHRISLAAVLPAAFCAALWAAEGAAPLPPPVPASPAPAAVPAPVPPAEVGVDEKLGVKIPLDAAFRDEQGGTVTLGQVISKPTILTLNYFRCSGICTPLLNGVVDVLNGLRLEPGRDFQVVTVSFDPRDTPDQAFKKRTNYLKQMTRPFPPEAWRFLTGDPESIRRLTEAVGFRYKADRDDFIHAGVILFLSPQGLVTRYIYGVSYLPADVEMALGAAARGEPGPTRVAQPSISKAFLFCYSYDPEGRRYVFNMKRVIGAAILVLAIGFFAYTLIRGRAGKEGKGSLS